MSGPTNAELKARIATLEAELEVARAQAAAPVATDSSDYPVDVLETDELIAVLTNDTGVLEDAGRYEVPAALEELRARAAGDDVAAEALENLGLERTGLAAGVVVVRDRELRYRRGGAAPVVADAAWRAGHALGQHGSGGLGTDLAILAVPEERVDELIEALERTPGLDLVRPDA